MKVKHGIRKKLETIILPIVAIAFVLVIIIAYNTSKGSIEGKTLSLLQAEAATNANSVEAWMNRNLGILDTAIDTMIYQNMNREALLTYEARYLETYEDFPNGIYIVGDDGKVIDASGWEPDDDPRQKSYYIAGKECLDRMKFVEAYIDDLTNEFVVTATRYVPGLNGTGGVVCTDISLAILSQVVANVTIEGGGDAFIIDLDSDTILAHNDQSIRGMEIKDVKDSFYSAVTAFCKEGSKASKSITSDTAGKYMVSYAPIEGTNWVVVVRALEKNVFSDLLHLGISLFIVGVVVIVGIVVVLVISIGRITTPIYNITKAIVAITDGDFTVDIPVTGNDEVTLMAKSLNTFMDKMRSTFGSFSDTSNRIDMQAEGSESIAEELHELASGQYEAMNNMMENLEELVKSIGAIAEDATTLALVASDTDEAGVNVISNISSTMIDADAGRRSMSEVTVAMSEAKESMGKLRKAVFDVGEAALKIDEITNTIKEIAGKTNLLALNASIEAARAGEAGKGFAVVATEIKELANTSADAANEIAELISSVSGLIQDTVKQSEMSEEQISSSAEMVEKASDQFNEIYGSIASTNDIVNVMIEKIHKTNDVASNMAAITEEQSASAEEIESTAVNVQALAQTVTNNSSQVKSDSGELTVTANELKAKISQFKI